MLKFNDKLEQIAMSSSGNKIMLEMQEHMLEKTIYCHSDQLHTCKVIRTMFIFS